MKNLILLGIRGVPAQYGGFETFAEHLCKYLVEQGWSITVYCQEIGTGKVYESEWEGVRRIHIPINGEGPLSTVIFDLFSVLHSLRQNGVFLTLGYNTAIFNLFHRVFGKTNVINMDGIEWNRQKWGKVAKAWFWINERFGCWFGNHLVADHPEIKTHLATRVQDSKITMIPYGAPLIEKADLKVLEEFGLIKDEYAILIARAEPENSILEVVKAFSSRMRNKKLVILGNYDSVGNPYHREVIAAASDEVLFVGAIYDQSKVAALRYFARFYVHGHQVGGTNPSLVEALGAGNAVLAHDNKFNRWVASTGSLYFANVTEAQVQFDLLFEDDSLVERLKEESVSNFKARFQWGDILQQYEALLHAYLPGNVE